MMINTHITMANYIMSLLGNDADGLIEEKWFIWGCVKPDCVSKYKLIKHYYSESYAMIIKKIKFLSSLSVEQIKCEYGRKKFSEEKGVVCHFLCDYFCLPHYERWQFKDSMKIHIFYEKVLGRRAKNYKPRFALDSNFNIDEASQYINDNLNLYKKEKGFRNDLFFSYKVSTQILNSILEEVKSNKYNSNEKAV